MGRVLRVVLLSVALLLVAAGPAAAATFTVTTTADSASAGTLRNAITQANATTAADDIAFAIPGAGPHTIALGSDLPTLTQPVTIDGYTQAGAAPANASSDAVLRVVIDCNEARGLVLNGGNATVKGLVIYDAQGPALPVPGTGVTQFIGDGVRIASSGNHVEGNWIGLTAAGTPPASAPEERNRSAGVRVVSGSGNVIGGATPAARNVLSGNGDFVSSEGEGGVIVNGGDATVVAGNRIGTTPAGTDAVPNSYFGVYLNGFNPGGTITNTTVGGTAAGAGNLISGNGNSGVEMLGLGGGNKILGNRIGTNAAGNAALPNLAIGAVRVDDGPVQIGDDSGHGNLISGNAAYGIYVFGDGHTIQGNRIGTDAAGTAALPNENAGISLRASGTTVGGTTAAAGNIVSGNNGAGIEVSSPEGVPGNAIVGNRIGVGAAGAALGNGGAGVRVGAGTGSAIGRPGEGNTIAHNGGDGVLVLGHEGTTEGNPIRGNSLHSNDELGIDLGSDGVTPNDSGDGDTGDNQLQNFPLVNASSTGASATVSGSLSSKPSTTYTIDVYESTACDASGNGEARTPVVSKDVTTNATGTVLWTAIGTVPAGRFVTATATDPAANTSELSACRAAGATADLSLTFGASATRPALGTNVTFTTTVQNAAGGGAATGVTVDAKLPPGYAFVSATQAGYNSGTGVWTMGSLAAGASTTLQVVARVDEGSPNDVFAEVRSSDQGDPDSVPDNGVTGEDDYGSVRVRTDGIWVNHDGTAVNASDGRCTLIEAITAANGDTASGSLARECSAGSGTDTIHLQNAATYSLALAHNSAPGGSPNALPRVTTPMTILGNGSRIRRAEGAPDIRLFYVAAAGSLRLENATVSHGRSGGGERCGAGLFSAGALTLVDAKVELNVDTVPAEIAVGGGICQITGSLALLRTTVSENTSATSGTAGGAGIYAFNAAVTAADSDIRQNVVQAGTSDGRGGGIYLQGGSLGMTGGMIRGNVVSGGPGSTVRYGGGLYMTGSTATLTDTIVGGPIVAFGNQALAGGGIALEGTAAKLTMMRGSLQENVANGVFNSAGGGGAIANGTGTAVGGEVTLTGVAITGNRAPNADGGGIFNRGNLLASGGSVASNSSLSGGGMSNGSGVFGGGGATLFGLTFTGNAATNAGGGLYVPSGSVSLTDSTVQDGSAATGGAVQVDRGTFTATFAALKTSRAHAGGGLAVFDGTATLSYSAVHDNDVDYAGGGIFVAVGGSVAVTGGSVTDNLARGSGTNGGGGGIANGGTANLAAGPLNGGTVTLTDATVAKNRAGDGDGGGIANRQTLVVRESTIRANEAVNGGGIRSAGPAGGTALVNVVDSSVDSNVASLGGGGISNWLASRLTSVRSGITRNSAGTSGGGIDNAERTDLDNSTLSGNSAAIDGGGIRSVTFAIAAVRSSTITDNTAPYGGAYTYYSPGGFTNSIIAGNHSPSWQCTGPPGLSLGNNLVADEGYCPRGAAGDARIEATAVATEVLEPLADNGGRGLSHRLRPGSPARDAGPAAGADPQNACSLGPDQTGGARYRDGDGDATAACDTGSVEEQSAPSAPLRLHRMIPAHLGAGGGPVTITLRGAGFDAQSVVRWDGSPRPTTFVSPVEIQAELSPADLAPGSLVRTVPVTVAAPDGTVTRPRPFAVTAPSVASVESSTVTAGGHASASSLPAIPGVVADLQALPGHPVTVTAATYSSNPAGGTVFTAGGFMDVQVTGAQPGEVLDAAFFYPSTITGIAEANLTLRYWTGSAWAPVSGVGGTAPAKYPTDNYGGTTSGGYFSVRFGDTSTPRLTELSGTVLAWTDDTPGVPEPPSPGSPADPPVLPADTAPPEAALSFSSAKRDVEVRDRTAVRGAAVKPSKSTKPKKGRSRRTYSLRDATGNALTVVVEVKKSKSAVSARVLTLKYGSARTRNAPANTASYQWTLRKKRVQKLTQTLQVGRRRVTAKYDRAKNRTTITDKTKSRRPVTKRGLAPVRLETAAGALGIAY